MLRPQRGHEAVRRVVDLLRLHQEQRKNFGRTRQHVLHSIEALERRLAGQVQEEQGRQGGGRGKFLLHVQQFHNHLLHSLEFKLS